MIFCDNSPCKTEATQFYVTEMGVPFFLCFTCGQAFEFGQVNPNTDLNPLEELLEFSWKNRLASWATDLINREDYTNEPD